MDLYDLFFGAGPGITILMKLGFMPQRSDFHELTPAQYLKYYQDNEDDHEKIFALLPSNQKIGNNVVEANEVAVFSEQNVIDLLKAEAIVENYCKHATYPLPTDADKLRYAASYLPDVFSKGTQFENSAPMEISKSEKQNLKE